MKIENLTMQNWMIYKGHQSVDFSVGTDNVTVIFGENMHGKTTLLNAIRWCLYGSAINRQNREISSTDLINTSAQREGERSVSVSLKFQADTSNYELSRSLDFSKPNPTMTKSMRIDGRVVDSGNFDNEIEAVLPEQISQFMLFDGELLRNFENLVVAVGSAQATGIKNAIEETLGIPLLKQAFESASIATKSLKKISDVELQKDAGAKLITEKIRAIELQRETDIQSKDTLEKQLKVYDIELAEIAELLHDTEQAIKHIERKNNIKDQLLNLGNQQKETKNQLKQISTNLWMTPVRSILGPRIKSYEQQLDQVRAKSHDAGQRAMNIMRLENSLKNSTCPTCQSAIPVEQIERMQKDLDELKRDVAADGDLNEIIYQLENKIRGLKFNSEFLDETEKYKAQLENDKRQDREILELENQISVIEQNLRGVDQKTSMSNRQKYDALIGEIAVLKDNIRALDEQISQQDSEVQQIRKSADYQQLSKSSDAVLKTEKAEQIRDILSKAISMYRDELRSDVEKRATETFRNLTTEKTFDKLEINESYGLNLIVDGTKVNRSAGAEQIVAMSLIEALNHHGRRKGPMIMDTPVGRLDLSHRRNILDYLPKVVTQLAIFAHSGELAEDTDMIDPNIIGARYKIQRKSTFEAEIVRV